MDIQSKETVSNQLRPIYIVSGGVGASGEQVVHTLLAQFPNHQMPVITIPHIRHLEQLEDIVAKAAATGGVIAHTLVDAGLRQGLIDLAQQQNVVAVDLSGGLLSQLTGMVGQEPLGSPGLYRRLNQDYFDRIAAIEYTVMHDDGKKPDDWPLADIMLVGVSRVGKTPLSMYLAVLGWKVANTPLVMEMAPAPELFQLDHHRVIGLTIEPGQLLLHRKKRQQKMGLSGPSAYTDPARVYEELEYARRVFQKNSFITIDVTDKPIETSSNEVIEIITRRAGIDAPEKKSSVDVELLREYKLKRFK